LGGREGGRGGERERLHFVGNGIKCGGKQLVGNI